MTKHNKICVIFTGGTIGSFSDGKNVDLIDGGKSRLIELYNERHNVGPISSRLIESSDCVRTQTTFDELRPVNILSENIQLGDLESIINCIKSIDCSQYDGIILTHGTDTLAFTANLLSQIFKDIQIPLVLVSALYPLDDSRSLGVENFKGGVDFINFADFGGVFVSFKFENEPQHIHLASRILWSDQLNGRFSSLLNKPFATIINEKVQILNGNPTVSQLKNKREPFGEFGLSDEIITIEARSLLNFKLYDFEKIRPKAVIIKLYHSGTVCTIGDNSVFDFIDYCNKLGVKVILTPVDKDANVYASAKNLTDKCHISYNQSYEMTVVKVMLALGSGLDIDKLLSTDNFFEHI